MFEKLKLKAKEVVVQLVENLLSITNLVLYLICKMNTKNGSYAFLCLKIEILIRGGTLVYFVDIHTFKI